MRSPATIVLPSTGKLPLGFATTPNSPWERGVVGLTSLIEELADGRADRARTTLDACGRDLPPHHGGGPRAGRWTATAGRPTRRCHDRAARPTASRASSGYGAVPRVVVRELRDRVGAHAERLVA